MANNLIELTAQTFDDIMQTDQPVLVDFWAPWCGPCRMLGPIIEELAEAYAGKAMVCKINVDDEQTLAQRFGVMSIPTVILFKNGEIVEKAIGAKPKRAFEELLDKHIS